MSADDSDEISILISPENEDYHHWCFKDKMNEFNVTCVKVMGASRVIYSAYLQANIPQSLPFIC